MRMNASYILFISVAIFLYNVDSFRAFYSRSSTVTSMKSTNNDKNYLPFKKITTELVDSSVISNAPTITEAKNDMIQNQEIKSAVKTRLTVSDAENDLRVATILGTTAFSLLFGNIFKVLVHEDDIAGWAPAIVTLLLSGTAYRLLYVDDVDGNFYGKNIKDSTSNSVKIILNTAFGSPLIRLKQSITKSVQIKIQETVTMIQNIPLNIKQSISKKKNDVVTDVQNKVENTKQELFAIPDKVANTLNQKFRETVADLKATPVNLSNRFLNFIETRKNQFTSNVNLKVRSIKNIIGFPDVTTSVKSENISPVGKISQLPFKETVIPSKTSPIPTPSIPSKKTIVSSTQPSNSSITSPMFGGLFSSQDSTLDKNPNQPAANLSTPVVKKAVSSGQVKPASIPSKKTIVSSTQPSTSSNTSPIFGWLFSSQASTLDKKPNQPAANLSTPVVKKAVLSGQVKPASIPSKTATVSSTQPSTSSNTSPMFGGLFSSQASTLDKKPNQPAANLSTPVVKKAVLSGQVKPASIPSKTAIVSSTQPSTSSNTSPMFGGLFSSQASTLDKKPNQPAANLSTPVVKKAVSSGQVKPASIPSKKTIVSSTQPSTSSNTSPMFGGLFSSQASTLDKKPNQPAANLSTPVVKKAVLSGQVKPASIPSKTATVSSTQPSTSSNTSPMFGGLFSSQTQVKNSTITASAVTSKFQAIIPNAQPPAVAAAKPESQASSKISSIILTENIQKSLLSVSVKLSPKDISDIDSALQSYLAGRMTTEGVYKTLVIVSKNSKDVAMALFPYCIGALPRSDKKSKLNQYYQQQ